MMLGKPICNQPPRRAPRDDTYTLPVIRPPEVWDKTRSQSKRRNSDRRSTIAASVSSALDLLCADIHGGRPGRGPSRLGPATAVRRSGSISMLASSRAQISSYPTLLLFHISTYMFCTSTIHEYRIFHFRRPSDVVFSCTCVYLQRIHSSNTCVKCVCVVLLGLLGPLQLFGPQSNG